MCLSIEDIVAKDGNFDGIPPAGISMTDYAKMMGEGNAEKAVKYYLR